MAARDGRVVEAHVRSEAAAETCPSLLERYHTNLPVVVEREVVASRVQLGTCTRKPGRNLDLMGADRLGGGVVPKDRRAPEAPCAPMRARRDLVAFMKGDGEPARLAAERARPGQRAGNKRVDDCLSLGPDRADDN